MNRILSQEEKKLLETRKKGFDSFLEERMPVLRDFMQSVGFQEPHMVLLDAESFLTPLEEYLKYQKIEENDKNWILTIIGYFFGEYFVQKYDGYWYLNDDPETHTFLKYVVGGFSKLKTTMAIDTFELAKDYVNEDSGRSLKKYIDLVEEQLKK